MQLEIFLKHMNEGKEVNAKSEVQHYMTMLSQEALKLTNELNNHYHSQAEIVQIMKTLTGNNVDDSFTMFPPFYTDCGKNIKLGKNVFFNSGCKIQDQGGVVIEDNVLLGHNVVIATLNHNLNPAKRGNMFPQSVHIGKNVWIGANATICPGVNIGAGVVIGAGAVVNKDIPENTIAVGVPARVIKKIT